MDKVNLHKWVKRHVFASSYVVIVDCLSSSYSSAFFLVIQNKRALTLRIYHLALITFCL